MVKVRIETKPAFKVFGRKIWIEGPDNEAFGRFWQECVRDGLLGKFSELHAKNINTVTNSAAIGVSCVEKDPSERSFYFYIASEGDQCPQGFELEEYVIPAAEWAIFSNTGNMPDSLVESEMYAFGSWLPDSGYSHAYAPELEAYPPSQEPEKGVLSEFWLPVIKK